MMLAMSRAKQHRYAFYLAILILLAFFVEIFWLRLFQPLENRFSDTLIARHAQMAATESQLDSDIVIVDIDERSLVSLADSVGRWPWPRAIHAELLQGIEQQKPSAVVFDILFSDADLTRPEGDAYFADVIANSQNSFFPMLRLNTDDHSQGIPLAKYGSYLGVVQTSDADPEAKVSMVLPLPAMLETGRLGTHNALADSDAVVRRYPMYFDESGWQVPSLPLTVAKHLGFKPLPTTSDIILNWHGMARHFLTSA